MATPEEAEHPWPYRARTVLGMVAVVVLVIAAGVVAKLLNPNLASMPPVMRMPPPAAQPPSSGPAELPAVATGTPAASPSPSHRSPRPRPPVSPPSTSAFVVGYEAEAAERDPKTQLLNVSGASGGTVVGYIGQRFYRYVRFAGVRVPSTGRYTLTIYYVCGDDAGRTAVLRVNGAVSTRRFAGSGAWDRVGSAAIRVDLRAGTNTIEFGNVPDSWAPDLDRIIVAR
jgi:hypothetical protein